MNTVRLTALVLYVTACMALWLSARIYGEVLELGIDAALFKLTDTQPADIVFFLMLPLLGFAADKLTETKFPASVLLLLFPFLAGAVSLFQAFSGAFPFIEGYLNELRLVNAVLHYLTLFSALVAASCIFEFCKLYYLPIASSVLSFVVFVFLSADYYFLSELLEYAGRANAYSFTSWIALIAAILFGIASYPDFRNRQGIYRWNRSRSKKEPTKYLGTLAGGAAAGVAFVALYYFLPFLFTFHNESILGFNIEEPQGVSLLVAAVMSVVAGQYMQVMGSVKSILMSLVCPGIGSVMLVFGQTGWPLFLCGMFYAAGAALAVTGSVPFSLMLAGTNRFVFNSSIFFSAALIIITVYEGVAHYYGF